MTSINFALTTLSDNPEYYEETIKLIEEEFHYDQENHFEKDFAPLMDPLNFENCFLYIDRDSNKVVAHLAVSLRTLIKGEAEMPVALIGGIVTHKHYRNKSLFKNLMNHVILNYKNKVGLFILWSDLENLYEKFHFYRTGGLIETGHKSLNSSDRPIGFEKTKFSLLSEKDFEAIKNLYISFNQSYFFTVKRDDRDWSTIKDMTTVDLFIKRNSSGMIDKYL